MRRRAGLKQQNVARQVAVRAEDRIRIVKMAAEGGPRTAAPTTPDNTE